MKNKIAQISMFVCGLSLLGVVVGMIAHLSDTMIRICGGVLLVSMIIVAYHFAKFMKGKK